MLVIGGCAYLTDERQGELIFRPVKGVWRGYSADRYTFKDHWIEVGKEHKLHAWWLEGERPDAPVVLYLHGARWNLTGSVTRIDRWRQLGFAVFAVDYRGFGRSTDVAPTEAYAYEDAEAAWDYLATIAPGRARYIVGHSLGGRSPRSSRGGGPMRQASSSRPRSPPSPTWWANQPGESSR